MGFTEYALLIVVVIGVPLAIAAAVTLWSLKQVRYRSKKRRPLRPPVAAEPPSDPAPVAPAGRHEPDATSS